MPTRFTKIVSKLQYLMILRRNCLQRAAENRISFEYVPVLEHIRRNPGCMQIDISKKLKITPAAVTQSTKKLESAGLIRKEMDEENLRIKHMYITDSGVEMLNYGTQIFDKIDLEMSEGMTDEEITQLAFLLDKVIHNLEESNFENIDERHLPWEFNK